MVASEDVAGWRAKDGTGPVLLESCNPHYHSGDCNCPGCYASAAKRLAMLPVEDGASRKRRPPPTVDGESLVL